MEEEPNPLWLSFGNESTAGSKNSAIRERRVYVPDDWRVQSLHRTRLFRSPHRRNLRRMSLIKKDGGSTHREGGQRREENNVAAGHAAVPNALAPYAR